MISTAVVLGLAIFLIEGALATSHKGIVTGERAGNVCFSIRTI